MIVLKQNMSTVHFSEHKIRLLLLAIIIDGALEPQKDISTAYTKQHLNANI